jgi:hypothetical protein
VIGEQPLSSFARQLLARERGHREADALKSRAVARARAAIEREPLSGIGIRPFGSGPLSARPRRAWRTRPLIGAASCAAGLAAAGAGLQLWNTGAPEEKLTLPAEVTASPGQPSRLAVGGGLLSTGSVKELAVEPPAEPPAPSPTTASDGTRSLGMKQYAAELLLLEPARTSLSRGDHAVALAALDQHRREFPNGQLSQEREALRVRALWGLGQKAAAMAAANAFRKRYPRSALLSWLKEQGTRTP